MIKELNIINYRGLNDVKIKFKKNLSVIYGSNGIGKTRIINFIEQFKLVLIGKNEVDVEGEIVLDNFIYYVKKVGDELERLTIKKNNSTKYVLFDFDKSSQYLRYRKNIIENVQEGKDIDMMIMFVDIVKNGPFKVLKKLLPNDVDAFMSEIWNVKTFNEDFLDFQIIKNTVFSINFDEDNKMHQINFERMQREVYEFFHENESKISNILNQIDNNIIEYRVRYNEAEFNNIHEVKIKDVDGWISIFSKIISNGVRHFFILIRTFKQFINSEDKVLFIDEFDPYLHDFLYKSLVSTLIEIIEEKKDKQIVFISHNSTIINMLVPQCIIFMYQSGNKVIAENLDTRGLNAKNTNFEKQYQSEKFFESTIYDSDLEELFYE